jgi:hypothetical protein
MLDLIRTLFRIRKKRRALPSSASPKIGSTIVRNNLKIKLSQPLDPELWSWLQLSGWRVNTVRNDRRAYVALSEDALARLIAAPPDQRTRLHARLTNSANGKR